MLNTVMSCRFSRVDWNTWSRCGCCYHTWDLACRPTTDRFS